MPVTDMASSSLVPPSLRAKTTILDRSLSKGKQEVSLASFALLFSETVQYCQARSSTVPELQGRLHDLGWQVVGREGGGGRPRVKSVAYSRGVMAVMPGVPRTADKGTTRLGLKYRLQYSVTCMRRRKKLEGLAKITFACL